MKTHKCPPHGKFTVGWIAALYTEYLAAKQVLDVQYDDPVFDASKGDVNAYTFGRIGEHHVVIATLPSGVCGTHPAAAVLNGMKSSFPLLQFVLMVGVAGGAPTAANDVRLGDVVVGTKMIPYSVNKRYANGPQFNGVPIMSETKLLSATHKVRANIAEAHLNLESIVSEKFVETEQIRDIFQRPDDKYDRLYQPGYEHTSTCDCLQDDSLALTPLVARPSRKQYDRIKVHCGAVGSADSVVKDATERDRLAGEFDLLCFEMESAGLMAGFPCLPIRGICDYSDSHKNKRWQGYAAAIAAVFALSLLLTVPYEDSQAKGNDIDTEALRQHIDLVVQTVMRVASPPSDGRSLTLEDAGAAMAEIRDTVQKLTLLSETSAENLKNLNSANEAAMEATKTRLNDIEALQNNMKKLLDELLAKIAKQHENSPQEERKEWGKMQEDAQEQSMSLKKTTKSTTDAMRSTAATLNNVATVTNNHGIAAAGQKIGATESMVRTLFNGIGSFRNATSSPANSRSTPAANRQGRTASTRITARPRGVLAPPPPNMGVRAAPTSTNTTPGRPRLPPRNGTPGKTRPDINPARPPLPPRGPSTTTSIRENRPVLPPRPASSPLTRDETESYTSDGLGRVLLPPSPPIRTPSTERSLSSLVCHYLLMITDDKNSANSRNVASNLT